MVPGRDTSWRSNWAFRDDTSSATPNRAGGGGSTHPIDGATFSVTGGTGVYRNASGIVTISGPVERNGEETFDFDFDVSL